MASSTTMATTTTMERAPAAAVLREFLLSVERTQQRVDSAVQLFAAHEDARLLRALLDVHPTAEPLLRIWPDGSAAARWENRDSMVAFLDVMTRVLRAQTTAAPESAAALAGKLVREKHASLEKMLTWNDKPALVCCVLELLRAVVDVSAAVARDFVRLFNLQSAPFVALATRRMKKTMTDSVDNEEEEEDDKKKNKQKKKHNKAAAEESDARVPQVRAAYVRLVDALASCPDKSVHRFALKEGGLVASLWKAIDGDDAEMLATVLARMKALVLENDAVDLRGRAAIFNAGAVQQLMTVLKSDDDATAELAFDMLHTLFLAENALHRVPSRRSLRAFLTKASTATANNHSSNDSSTNEADAATGAEAAAAAVSVRLIRTAVTSVGVNEFIRHEFARRLALELVRAYPGVLAEYLGVVAPQLEPKPGYRWFSVANMVHRLLSCALDAAVDDVRQDAQLSLSSSTLASRVICPLAWRKELTRCLQHSSDLVVYTALGLVEASLQRYQALAPWLSARSEIQDELRFLLPSPEVLVSLLLRLSSQVQDKGLVYIRALAVARLYLECLPDAMSEVKADVSKLVPWDALDSRAQTTPLQHAIAGEILRFLAVVDDSRLSALLSVDSRQQRSKLLQLLLLFVSNSSDTIRCLSKCVLTRLLAVLKVFGNKEEDAEDASNLEILMWLDELRFSGESCAVFLDAIVQELVNNPFAFVADLHSRVPADAASADARRSVSPALLALVSVLHDKDQDSADDLWKNSAAMGACRSDPAVLDFAARVVLAAIVRSRRPEIVARLVVADSVTLSEDDESRSRKRRRTDPPVTYNSSPLGFLTLVCQRILSSQPLARQLEKTSKKTANASPLDLLTMAPEALGTALVTLPPSAFVASLRRIDATTNVHDAVSSLLARYVSVHPELQVIPDFLSLTVAKTKKTKTTRAQWLEALPCRVFGRHLVFLLSADLDDAPASRSLELLQEISQSIPHASADDVAALARNLVLCLRLMNARNTETQALSKSAVAVLMTALASLLSRWESSEARATIAFVADSLDDLVRANAQCSHAIVAGFLATTALLSRTALSPAPTLCARRLLVSGWRVLALTCLANSTQPTLQSRQLCKLLRGSGAVNATLTRHLVVSIDAATLSCPRAAGARLLAVVRDAPVADADIKFFSAALSIIRRCGGFPTRQSVDDWSALVTAACANDASAASVDDVRTLLRRLFALTLDARDDSGVAWGAGLLERCVTSLKSKHSDALLVLLVASLPLVDFASLPSFVRDVLEQLLYERLCALFRGDSKMERAMEALVLWGVRQLATDARFGSLRRTVNDIVAAQQSTGVAFTTVRCLALSLLVRGSSPTSDLNAAAVLEFLARSALKTFALLEKSNDSALQCIALVVDDLVRAHRPLTLSKGLTQALRTSLQTLASATTDVASVADYVQLVRLSGILLRLIESSTSPSSFDCDALRRKLTTSEWFSVALATPDADTDVALLEVVAALLRLTSAYDRELFTQLLGAYNMSLSRRDRMIRALLKRFESAASLLPSLFGYRFGSALASASLQDAGGHLIQDATWLVDGGLDASRVRATIEFFPLDRDMDDPADHALLLLNADGVPVSVSVSDSDALVYDPAYLLPLLSHYVSASSISDAVLAQQGVIGVALRAASSNALSVREYAFALLAHVHEAFSSESSEFKPARQVHLLLDALRHALAEPLEPVSSVLTVFLNDAVSILCRPAHSMYAALNHFLLARPALDLNDVPMFYALFNSRTPQLYKQERAWLLHTLRRGVREDADVALLIRRHVPTILLSFFTSELADEHTRLLVGSVLRLMLQTSTGSVYLVTKCGFLDWCAAQLNKTASLQSAVITRLLVQLVDDALQSGVWSEIDDEQQRSLGAGAINCFWALRHATDSSEKLAMDADTHARVLHVSEMVATRAASVSCCSLATLAELFSSVASSVHTTITMACATAALSESELLRRNDFQKHRFAEWARVIARVVQTVESSSSSRSSALSMADRECLHVAMTRISSVLRLAPSLRDHVLSELARQSIDWCPLLA